MLFLLNNNHFDHSGKDLLSHLVLPKDIFLWLGLHHQASDTELCLLVFFDKRVDVLRHSFGHNTMIVDVLFVVLEDPHHMLEVVLVDSDLVLQPVDRGPDTSVEDLVLSDLLRDLHHSGFNRGESFTSCHDGFAWISIFASIS